MSAPTIPNLKSLRRGGLRGRGTSRTTLDGEPSPHNAISASSRDEIIKKTDQDAASSRLSAVEAGYLEDPFAKLLTSTSETPRRLPLMNRGTYVRTTAIDHIVDAFLSSEPSGRKQIVSLGAGSDTRYFRIRKQRPQLNVVYHEIDFPSNTKTKIAHLRDPSSLSMVREQCGLDLLSAEFRLSPDNADLQSPDYCIHGLDLRQLAKSEAELPSLDISLPTLLISECCLIYLPPLDADAVLQYFKNIFGSSIPLAVVIYEPIKPGDAFGRTMVTNLTARGIQLQTFEKYAGLNEQRNRLLDLNFGQTESAVGVSSDAHASDIDFIWRKWIDEPEKDRVDSLEWMDEVEEFVLLARHYCVAWGWRGFGKPCQLELLPAQDGEG